MEDDGNIFGASSSFHPQDDPLSTRLELLGSQLASYIDSNHSLSDDFDRMIFRHFFTASNVAVFATTLCRKRHYQYPIIHWPTLVLEDISLPLLLAISLTGAAYSIHEEHGKENITVARSFYRLADSFVFDQLDRVLEERPTEADITTAIQACQAGLLMYALKDLLVSDATAISTTVFTRLPNLVSALRRLNFTGCRHSDDEDPHLFLCREQITRLVAWTYCADCLATLCYNKPPCFSLTEMTGDLPCDPALWETGAPYAEVIRRYPRPSSSKSLVELMSQLLADGRPSDCELEHLPVFHVHVMLCAIQPIIFNLHVSMALEQQAEKLLHALDKWRGLWRETLELLTDEDRKWLGVAKYISGLEHLSRRIVEVAISADAASSQYLRRLPSTSSRYLHTFLRTFVV
ncbi:uncharacterized protein LTR77_010675 [Saxophila tyrrhenica]|uniref:Xylanolytic transcriptional activator regulatory domain-containing protein n=1 Tax=Saxophila tyrrhenica TaxID=1690608 RepID=A0AAV9NV05_9PEZI|nr:hypothetical protein LTR77_010675 [Saxophila tyrrhenica]